MRRMLLLFIFLSLAGCEPREVSETATEANPGHSRPIYELTEIPININTVSDEQKALIQREHASDPTPYLMQSRPIVCQIVETTNNADEVRYAGPITERTEVMIYALGEADGDELVDHGWLENVSTGATVWKMTFEHSEYGGGDLRNRNAVDTLWLDPGRYELHYVSNDTHALGDWRGEPPEREPFYGVVVFNLAAIDNIKEQCRESDIAIA